MDRNADKYIGKILDERYEILELIGTGGMANVYKALCHRLNRYDAVKIMRDETAANEEFRERFRAESQAVAMLSHPNIVSVYDVSHSDDVEYIVMELVDGISLKQYLQKVGALKYRDALNFTTQIARALSHAHERGIIHRDIKPQNIMLLRDGRVKVADFGIAALQNSFAGPSDEAVGSVHYIAPEQARGYAADARSDIYSLGIVMYEMLTGRLPYTGDSAVEIAVKHMNTKPVPPSKLNPQIPEELERITMKAMSAEIDNRYQSADELLADLEAFHNAEVAEQVLADTGTMSVELIEENLRAEEERKRIAKKEKRSRKIAFGTGILGVLIFIILIFIFINGYFLKDLFGTPERLEINNFVNRNYEDVINDSEYNKTYKFTVTFKSDSQLGYGMIISQTPEAGSSRSRSGADGKIDVELLVSSGDAEDNQNADIEIPNVVNNEDAIALRALEKLGFKCSVEQAPSDSIAEGNVVSTDPAAGESAAKGSTVNVVVSTGHQLKTKSVPQLKGLSKDAAIEKITANGLTVGEVTTAESKLDEGTVIWQSQDAGTEVDENTPISIQVSSGQAG